MKKDLQLEKKCYILAIETTGKEASVALINCEGAVSVKSSKEELSHLKNLMPLIKELLVDRELSINDIACFAVSEGPGSFTGIRIGVTTARALAQTLNAKIIGVPTLKSFGESLDIGDIATPEDKLLICPLFDARRNQVYGTAFINLEESVKDIIPDGCYDLDEFLADLNTSISGYENISEYTIMFYGDGAVKNIDKIKGWIENNQVKALIASESYINQSAENIARLALKMLRQGLEKEFSDVMPVYLRKAEAETKLEAGRS